MIAIAILAGVMVAQALLLLLLLLMSLRVVVDAVSVCLFVCSINVLSKSMTM